MRPFSAACSVALHLFLSLIEGTSGVRKLKARGWLGWLNESYAELVLKFKAAEIAAVSDETMTVISSYIGTLRKVANPLFFHALA